MAPRADGKPKTYTKPMGPPAPNPVHVINGELVKKCTACEAVLPLTMYRSRDHYKAGAFYARCKACSAAYSRLWHAAHKDAGAEKQRRWRAKNGPRASFLGSVGQAMRRWPAVNPVTVDYLLDMLAQQAGKCALSGVTLTFGGGLNWSSCSMDRIDQDVGYEIGNIRLVAHAVNAFRGQMTDDKMWDLVAQMYAKRPK